MQDPHITIGLLIASPPHLLLLPRNHSQSYPIPYTLYLLPRNSIPARATNRAGSSPTLVIRMFLKSSLVNPMAVAPPPPEAEAAQAAAAAQVKEWACMAEGVTPPSPSILTDHDNPNQKTSCRGKVRLGINQLSFPPPTLSHSPCVAEEAASAASVGERWISVARSTTP